MEYYSAIKNNEILPFATRMNPEGVMLSAASQREKDKHRMISLTCGISKKSKQINNRNSPLDIENNLTVARGRRPVGRWMEKVKGDDRHALPVII